MNCLWVLIRVIVQVSNNNYYNNNNDYNNYYYHYNMVLTVYNTLSGVKRSSASMTMTMPTIDEVSDTQPPSHNQEKETKEKEVNVSSRYSSLQYIDCLHENVKQLIQLNFTMLKDISVASKGIDNITDMSTYHFTAREQEKDGGGDGQDKEERGHGKGEIDGNKKMTILNDNKNKNKNKSNSSSDTNRNNAVLVSTKDGREAKECQGKGGDEADDDDEGSALERHVDQMACEWMSFRLWLQRRHLEHM